MREVASHPVLVVDAVLSVVVVVVVPRTLMRPKDS
jgi:hypothetical protein